MGRPPTVSKGVWAINISVIVVGLMFVAFFSYQESRLPQLKGPTSIRISSIKVEPISSEESEALFGGDAEKPSSESDEVFKKP